MASVSCLRLVRKGMVAPAWAGAGAGAAAMTVTTTTATIWMGENSFSKISSRLSSTITEAASRKMLLFSTPPQRQRFVSFSTSKVSSSTSKSASQSTTTTTAAAAEAAAAATTRAATKSSSTTTASTASKSTVNNKKSFSFLEWYEGHLESRPVVTKMFTGCFLWGVGDAVAQLVPPMFYPSEDNTTVKYDFPRTGRAALFGFALHAPTSHVHFNFLEWLTIRTGVTGLSIPFFKAFMEQFVYWSWLSNSMYHGAMGAMQGMNMTQIYHRIEDVLWETQKAQWAFWIPVQLLNFQFVPVRHQLNVVLLTSIVWTALLSAWYPPTEDEKQEKEEETTTTTTQKLSE